MDKTDTTDPLTVTGESWLEVANTSAVSQHPHVQKLLHDNPTWTQSRLIPERITLETFFGCNAKCVMCVINDASSRKKGMGIMSMAFFRDLVDRLLPYREHIQMMDFTALGEPLLDRHLFERIRLLKDHGFPRLAFASNVDLLTPDKQQELLESGVDTVMIGIDGMRKETHESIRPGVTFERVMEHTENTIRLRDQGNYKTRFLIRFVRQPGNYKEWDEYKAYWQARLSPEKGDELCSYDVYSWGGRLEFNEGMPRVPCPPEELDVEPCHHVFRKLTILADGSVPLCAIDILDPQFGFDNAIEGDIVDIFNAPRLRAMRALHLAGKRKLLKVCDDCDVLCCERNRVFI